MTKLLNLLPRRIREHEDALLGLAVAWFVGVPLSALTGFYLGTIIGHAWYAHPSVDYQAADMARGGIGALIGLGIGILGAILATVFYPRLVEADAIAHAKHKHH
jgi:hypothetical protein